MPGGGERREGPTEDELGKGPWDLGRRQWLVTW